MRIYNNFKEAIEEIRRDLAEMGIRVHTKTYQDKNIEDKPEYESLELQNYTYMVTNPKLSDIKLKSIEWAEAEFGERINKDRLNPGKAWKLRDDIWGQFREKDGKFSYTYSERLSWQVETIIQQLITDPNSRQLFMAVWNPEIDIERFNRRRLPCSLGYWFNYRNGELNITYLMRSCDMNEHYLYDIYLATSMMRYIAEQAGMKTGSFCQWIGSFHVFRKDVENVF